MFFLDRTIDLMKKGLRQEVSLSFPYEDDRTIDLMKKGLRRNGCCFAHFVIDRTIDLMKKGLRLARQPSIK